MLDFDDRPYQFIPPRPNFLAAQLITFLNRIWHLPRRLKIDRVQASGALAQPYSWPKGARLILMANHPTHADAPILLEACRQVGIWPCFMAAYEVFQRGRFNTRLMQSLGAFSVDRDGFAKQSMECAMSLLRRPPKLGKRRGLTIFPQGNVYLENDRAGVFLEGAAFLACRAAKELKDTAPVFVIPVAIKASFSDEAQTRAAVGERLSRLENMFGLTAQCAPILDRLSNLGLSALRRNLSQRGWDCPEAAASLKETIQLAAGTVLDDLERKMGVTSKLEQTAAERIRNLRKIIHEIRVDPDRVADHSAAEVWADHAMIALRITSYSGDYVSENPSIDRVAETVEKLEEDITRNLPPVIARRSAFVRFGEPIDVCQSLERHVRVREAAAELCHACQCRVQSMLDEINAENCNAGRNPF